MALVWIEAGRIFLTGILDPVLHVVDVNGRTTLALQNILHFGQIEGLEQSGPSGLN